ncbi:hypothetical protein [Algivirga pacifica]|uniref:Uncharacterized protein n=1 Tax=Algivirga pacifica TaxID=1162670 RepID=A0ABP9DAU9_9BACT
MNHQLQLTLLSCFGEKVAELELPNCFLELYCCEGYLLEIEYDEHKKEIKHIREQTDLDWLLAYVNSLQLPLAY